MVVYVIGMPGCGKSKTCKYLQIEKNFNSIDLDRYIEELAKMDIPSIFSKYGEGYFRTLETRALKLVSETHVDTIVSCGGGVVVNPLNKEAMKNGVVVFLDASIETLKRHLENSSHPRPLLKEKTIEQIYDERIALYHDFADYVIPYDDYVGAAMEIMNIIKEESKKKILVINGPNLNMLGLRDPNHYGSLTLAEINKMMEAEQAFNFEFYQSNCEGEIVTKIQTYKNYDAIIINPAAYTHTSVAIHDALEIVDIPKVEVHLSKVNEREEFRKINFVRSVVDTYFEGEKALSYMKAIDYLKKKFNVI